LLAAFFSLLSALSHPCLRRDNNSNNNNNNNNKSFSPLDYATSCVFYGLSVLGKSAAVPLPVALVAMEVSCRRSTTAASAARNKENKKKKEEESTFLVADLALTALAHWPLFLVCGAAANAALAANDSHYNTAPTLSPIMTANTWLNAVSCLIAYICLMLAPTGLTISYPEPTAFVRDIIARQPWVIIAAAVVLGGALAAAVANSRKGQGGTARGLFLLGLAIVAMLAPTLGIVAVHTASAIQDRYTYLPSVAIAVAFSFALAKCNNRNNNQGGLSNNSFGMYCRRRAVWAAALFLLAPLLTITSANLVLEFWRNPETLFRRAAALEP
jgi:hypothetical protein